MQQKYGANQNHHKELFDEAVAQVVNGVLDQRCAVVGFYKFDTIG